MTGPGNSDEAGLFALAIERLDQDRAAEILPAVEQSCAANPRSARLWHVRALLLRDLDRRREALAAFDRASSLVPQQPRIAVGRAHTRFEAGLPAVDTFAAALGLNPGNQDVIVGLTHALLAEGRFDEAILGLDRLLQRSPAWVEGHEILARIRWTAGERAGFARSFDAALAVHPRSLDLRRAQLVTLVHANLFDEALAAVRAGRGAVGEDVLFDAHDAIIAAERGEIDRALALFEPLADIDDGSIQVRRMRLFLRAGRPRDALAVFDRFAQPGASPEFIPYASLAWRMLGDPQWDWLEGDPRLVGVFDLADRLPPLDELADHLRSLHRAKGQQLEQSVRGGTQTEGDLLTSVHPLIEQTASVIREAVRAHTAQLPPPDPRHPLLSAPRDRRARFAGSWSVRLTSGGHHTNHVHPMGWLSSALYIALPPAVSEADHAGWLTLGEPQAELGLALQPFRFVQPKPGRLVLFPSTMWHGTVPFTDAGERLTIAFDVAQPA